MTHEKLWLSIYNELEGSLPRHAISTWFEPILPVALYKDELVLEVPNQFFYEWIESHYSQDINKALSKLSDRSLDFRFIDSAEKIDVPIFSELNYVIKQGIVKDFEDENVIFINESDKELNLDNILYEMIVLAFPTKRQHKLNSVKNDECNKEMVNLINKYSIKEQKDFDPRWEALKKLK